VRRAVFFWQGADQSSHTSGVGDSFWLRPHCAGCVVIFYNVEVCYFTFVSSYFQILEKVINYFCNLICFHFQNFSEKGWQCCTLSRKSWANRHLTESFRLLTQRLSSYHAKCMGKSLFWNSSLWNRKLISPISKRWWRVSMWKLWVFSFIKKTFMKLQRDVEKLFNVQKSEMKPVFSLESKRM